MTNPGHRIALGYGRWAPVHPGRWSLIAAMIRRFGLRRPVSLTAARRGVLFRLRLDRFLDVHLYYAGVHDAAETAFLEANVAPGDTVFDVGANFGYYTLVAARRCGPSGRVHAFEISRDEMLRLEENLALNPFAAGVVHLHRLAVMDGPGHVPITPTLGAGTTHLAPGAGIDAERVPGVSLDQFAREHGVARVDFVKCDIEGAEMLMLRGARELLRVHRPLLVLEINPGALAGFDATGEEIVRALESLDYALFRFAWTARGRRLVRLRAEDMPRGEDFINVAGVPRERLPDAANVMPLRVPRRERG